MKVRELLQTEIWSKGTTRKLVIGFAILIAGIATWIEFDARWLTGSEREAARNGLFFVDSLQLHSAEDDQKDFDARKQKAEEAVEAAKRAAWTTRDRQISSSLSAYLIVVASDRDSFNLDKDLKQRNVVFPKSDDAFDAKLKAGGIQVRQFISVALHSALDK